MELILHLLMDITTFSTFSNILFFSDVDRNIFIYLKVWVRQIRVGTEEVRTCYVSSRGLKQK